MPWELNLGDRAVPGLLSENNVIKTYKVKLVYNDHPWDLYVAVVDRWSLFVGSVMKIEIGTPKLWSL